MKLWILTKLSGIKHFIKMFELKRSHWDLGFIWKLDVVEVLRTGSGLSDMVWELNEAENERNLVLSFLSPENNGCVKIGSDTVVLCEYL